MSSVLAPWVTTKILLMGANPAAAFATGAGDVGQATLAGGVGAAVSAATGGAAAPLVIAAAASGALASGTESAARGGGSPRTTGTLIAGWTGMNAGKLMRRNTTAAQIAADAERRRADSAISVASAFSQQPHNDDPNKAARDIDTKKQ